MPRSLIELRQSMPDVELIPYPVKAPRLEAQWWSDSRTAWVLGKEYIKFITAMARYAANHMASGQEKTVTNHQVINARAG